MTRELLGPNKRGELCMQTPCMTIGYLNKPQQTKEAFDEDGFLKTGAFLITFD